MMTAENTSITNPQDSPGVSQPFDPDNLPPMPSLTFLRAWHLEKMKVGDRVGIQSSPMSGHRFLIKAITKISPSGQITVEGGWRFTKGGIEIGATGYYRKTLHSVEYVEWSLARDKASEMRSHCYGEIQQIAKRLESSLNYLKYSELRDLRNRLYEIEGIVVEQSERNKQELSKKIDT